MRQAIIGGLVIVAIALLVIAIHSITTDKHVDNFDCQRASDNKIRCTAIE